MLQDAGMPLSFQKLFLVDPKAFSDCSADATVSREGLRQCVLASQTGRVNLPLGWTESNRRLSFCHVVTFALKSKPTKPTPPVHDEVEVKNPADPGAWDHFVCGTQINFAGNEALRLPRIQLEGPGGGDLIAFVIGLFITAFFVALGAPFWFDVLGRAVKLRAAGGKARDDALTTPDGGRGGGAPGGSALPPGPGGDEPFSPARNDIERRLPAGDLIALQGALGVERTGVWDRATRQRMADESLRLGLGGSDELTNQLYLALLGRSPAGLTVLQPPSSSIKLRAEDSRCTVTADALMRLVAFPGRVPITANTMNDDLRALAVLWRYKNEAESNPLPHTRPVRTRANARHELDDISAAELAAILEQSKRVPALTYARESAPWLDWALGELGQGEACDPAAKTRDASNPRILEYHAAAGSPADVESTAWCASFVSWVLTRYNQTCPPNTAVTSAAAPNASHFGGAGSSYGTSVWSATGAISWAAVPAAAPVLAGDVITFHVSTGHAGVNHVGFVLEVESGGAWVLSGNFSNRVGIDFFTVPAIVEIRRP